MSALDLRTVIEGVGARLLALLQAADDRSEPVVRQASPDTLALAFQAAGAGLPIDRDQAPTGTPALLAAVDEVLRWSVRTLHPRFFNQNFAGADPVAVLGDWVGAALTGLLVLVRQLLPTLVRLFPALAALRGQRAQAQHDAGEEEDRGQQMQRDHRRGRRGRQP